MAQVLFLPISAKLKTYSQKELLSKRMIIEGIMAIQSGDNPRIVEHKLSVFLPPGMRLSREEGKSGGE
jgi:chemotaxis protein MotA